MQPGVINRVCPQSLFDYYPEQERTKECRCDIVSGGGVKISFSEPRPFIEESLCKIRNILRPDLNSFILMRIGEWYIVLEELKSYIQVMPGMSVD